MATSSSSSGSWRGSGGRRDDPRGGGMGGSSGSRGGGFRNNSGGDNWRGGGSGGGDNWRGGGSSSTGPRSGSSAGGSNGGRPRLNLKPRGGGGKNDGSSTNPPTEKLANLSTLDSGNSRAAALGAAPSSSRRDNNDRRPANPSGPPPPVNSRFSRLAATEERSSYPRRNAENAETTYNAPRGPPPPVANSRFAAAAAAAEAERAEAPPPAPRGPPPAVTNSRFAAAAAMAEQDEARRMAEREERNAGYGGPRSGGDYQSRGGAPSFGRNSGPPPVANSRFAAAVAADADYLDKDDRDRRDREMAAERGRDRDGGGYRGGGYGGRGGMGGGGYGGRGGGGGFRMDDLPKGPRASQWDDLPKGPRASMDDHYPAVTAGNERVNALLSLPKQKSQQSAPLEPIAKEHEGNMLELPKAVALTKDKEEELVLGVPQKERPAVVEPVIVTPAPPAENAAEIMAEFVSGTRLGEDLKTWTEEHRTSLPMLDKVIFELLDKVEKLNPNPECLWAEPDKYGAALLSLTEDDIVNQMHVLWGIQFYCDKLGFPKLNDEYIVQGMFRAMYKYDLVEEDAFIEWKEDETDAFEKGKLKAVIQTTEWFAWLEEEDEEEEEEDEEEELEE